MKLSEILLGATIPQCRRKYYETDDKGNLVAACAIGCIGLRYGMNNDTIDTAEVRSKVLDEFGIDIIRERGKDPVTNAEKPLDIIILNCNDKYLWSLQEIGGWLKSLGL